MSRYRTEFEPSTVQEQIDEALEDDSSRPLAPENVTMTFLTDDRIGRQRIRLRVTWDEVTQAEDGSDARKIDRYVVHLQHSLDGGVTWNENFRRQVVDAHDADDGDTAKAIFQHIKKFRYYRVRVRAVDRLGVKGILSDWSNPATPNDTTPPPAPVDVRIFENSTGKRVVIDWDGSPDPDDADDIDDEIQYFQVQVSKDPDFDPVYRKDKRLVATRISFRIADADLGDYFYARVRSVDASKNKSAWIPATIAGNSDSEASASGVLVGASGGRFTQAFTKNGLIETKLYNAKWVADGTYNIKKARVVVGTHDSATHPNDGCPVGGSVYVQLKKFDTTDANPVNIFPTDERLKVDAGTHRDTAWAEDATVTTVGEDEILRVRVSKDPSTTYVGKDLSVIVVLESA